jgi:hypothetical protein
VRRGFLIATTFTARGYTANVASAKRWAALALPPGTWRLNEMVTERAVSNVLLKLDILIHGQENVEPCSSECEKLSVFRSGPSPLRYCRNFVAN